MVYLYQNFHKSKVDPLQKELDALKSDIQGLIQSGGWGENFGGIDGDMEALQESWSDLSEKVRVQTSLHSLHFSSGRVIKLCVY